MTPPEDETRRPDDDTDADQSPAVSTGAEALDEDRLDRDPWDFAIDPPADWEESDRFGITGPEQRDGPSLDQRLAQEEADDVP